MHAIVARHKPHLVKPRRICSSPHGEQTCLSNVRSQRRDGQADAVWISRGCEPTVITQWRYGSSCSHMLIVPSSHIDSRQIAQVQSSMSRLVRTSASPLSSTAHRRLEPTPVNDRRSGRGFEPRVGTDHNEHEQNA